jgi:hypothetical protein
VINSPSVAHKLSYLVRNEPGKLGRYGAVLSNALPAVDNRDSMLMLSCS